MEVDFFGPVELTRAVLPSEYLKYYLFRSHKYPTFKVVLTLSLLFSTCDLSSPMQATVAVHYNDLSTGECFVVSTLK